MFYSKYESFFIYRSKPDVTTTNEVETYPTLFTVDLANSSNHRYLRAMCPKARPSRTCQVVKVNISALKASKMRFLLLTQWPPIEESSSDTALLKKTSEEGLDLVLEHPKEGATATITYEVIILSLLWKNNSKFMICYSKSWKTQCAINESNCH